MVDDVDQKILDRLRLGPASSTEVAEHLDLSRQATHRRLQKLVDAGIIERQGSARATRYSLSLEPVWRARFERSGLEEHEVFREMKEHVSLLREISDDARDLVSYAVTEMVNNAIDHSAGRSIQIQVRQVGTSLVIEVDDDGVGAFAHVRDRLGLPDELAALQEIVKGKTTTDPERHSGEGLFFVSKAVDTFRLESGALRWIVDNRRDDWTVEPVDPPRRGTFVGLELDIEHVRDLQAIFERFTEDYEFTKTRIVIELFSIGVRFVSRSEAKRLVNGLDRFREVILDFKGVEKVGQGFADEVFRVWATAHPTVQLIAVNMNDTVAFMVERARR